MLPGHVWKVGEEAISIIALCGHVYVISIIVGKKLVTYSTLKGGKISFDKKCVLTTVAA